jgi:plasmid stabilization system protein ParE
MTFHVKALPRAEADIRSIASYIHDRSPQGAKAWLDAFRSARVRLADNAESCPLAPEDPSFDIELRHMLFKTKHGRFYRLLFTIVGNEVRILRVRGSGQAPVHPDDLKSF